MPPPSLAWLLVKVQSDAVKLEFMLKTAPASESEEKESKVQVVKVKRELSVTTAYFGCSRSELKSVVDKSNDESTTWMKLESVFSKVDPEISALELSNILTP